MKYYTIASYVSVIIAWFCTIVCAAIYGGQNPVPPLVSLVFMVILANAVVFIILSVIKILKELL